MNLLHTQFVKRIHGCERSRVATDPKVECICRQFHFLPSSHYVLTIPMQRTISTLSDVQVWLQLGQKLRTCRQPMHIKDSSSVAVPDAPPPFAIGL